jgi:hypothetical protein
MPTPKQQRRRALELLEASIDGCTEAIMQKDMPHTEGISNEMYWIFIFVPMTRKI